MTDPTRSSAVSVIAGAALVGALFGAGSLAFASNEPAARVPDTPPAATIGSKRQREPQVGDVWGGCNDARAAGSAPLYRGEPGYRSEMDGDDDGIACEPHRG